MAAPLGCFVASAVMLLRTLASFALFAALFTSPAFPAEKLKPEAVVARHLEALAPAEARQQLAGRRIGGSIQATFRIGGTGRIGGSFTLASQGLKALYAMIFRTPEYPYERFIFDGKSLQVGQLKPGVRSQLCQFLYVQDEIFHAGIFGGSLTTGWALLDPARRGARLDYAGLRKIDGRPVHELRIRPKKATDLQISLFFDEGSFHHLRTQYRLLVAAAMGARPEDSSSQQEAHHELIEDFADFRPEGPWMLPHQYKIQLSLEGQGATVLYDWAVALAKFDLQASLADADFNIQN